MHTDVELDNLCKNIYRIRKKHGLSQRQMAQIMGIGVYSLRKIETGVVPPRMGIQAVFDVCKAFHISSRAIFGEVL